MALDDRDLVDAIERGIFLLPETPDYLHSLPIEGIKGQMATLSHPYANAVGLARLSATNAEPTIEAVKNLYAEQDKAFTWMVGPTSTPTDLGERLTKAGLRKFVDIAGMAFTDFSTSIDSSPDVRARMAGPDESELVVLTMIRAGQLSEEFTRFIVKMRQAVSGRLEIRAYLAFAQGIDDPVGFASMTYFPDSPIVELGGAATVAEHRGRGVYTSLLAQRVADACERGIEAAVVQAARTTSAPVCARHGFVEMCALEDYLWIPDRLAADLRGEWGLDGSLLADSSPQSPN